MNQIKISKSYSASLKCPAIYCATGHVAGELSQYTITNQEGRWSVTRVYGRGPHFQADFATKRQAVEAIRTA
jgi:hypothetical protein